MTPKLVIFDCDGVLVDTEPTTNIVIAQNLARYGLPLEIEQVDKLFVGGTIAGVMTTASKMGATLPDNWLDEIYGEMFDALRLGVDVFPEVGLFLDALDEMNIAYAIASNGPLEKMEVTLTPSGLKNRFAGRIYSGHDYIPKPAPGMIEHAMQVAGATKSETIFIDDSFSGASAGIAAGVRTFGFDPSRAFTHLADLAVAKVGSMREIAGLIGVKMPPA